MSAVFADSASKDGTGVCGIGPAEVRAVKARTIIRLKERIVL